MVEVVEGMMVTSTIDRKQKGDEQLEGLIIHLQHRKLHEHFLHGCSPQKRSSFRDPNTDSARGDECISSWGIYLSNLNDTNTHTHTHTHTYTHKKKDSIHDLPWVAKADLHDVISV